MRIMCAYNKLEYLRNLKPNPRNPNKHSEDQIKLLAKIMNMQGIRAPIVISNRSGLIIKGHARLEAAKLLNYQQYPCDYQNYEHEDMEYADMVADNKIAELAESDDDVIQSIALDLGPDFDLDLFGIPDFKVSGVDTLPPDKDEDAVPEVIQEPQSKLGQIYRLGDHRLMCGDAKDKEMVDKLMKGQKVDLLFTDPPYGINIVANDGTLMGQDRRYKKEYKKVIADDKEFDATFLLKFECNKIIWGGNFLCHLFPKGSHWIVWDKRGDNMKGGSSAGKQSDCELAWTDFDRTSVKKYKHVWTGWFREGSIGEELSTKIHPTQKPVGLIKDILEDYKKEKILDLFGGSGSTLIACENTKRRCFMMEIDPHYIDVIIKRWENYSGKKAEPITDNEQTD